MLQVFCWRRQLLAAGAFFSTFVIFEIVRGGGLPSNKTWEMCLQNRHATTHASLLLPHGNWRSRLNAAAGNAGAGTRQNETLRGQNTGAVKQTNDGALRPSIEWASIRE